MPAPLPIDQEFGRSVQPLPPAGGTTDTTAGSTFTLPMQDDENELEEQQDGSVLVRMPRAQEEDENPEFLQNLADRMSSAERHLLALELLELIERDKEARTERDKMYAEGIKRTGMTGEKTNSADFEGASAVVHPVLIEGCVDFAARAMKELMPASGPVRTQIIGESTTEKVDRAERKRRFMNWQLTSRGKRAVKEYRAELERLLTQLPLSGGNYLKWWYDERVERPRVELIPIDECYLPAATNDFYTAHRFTHAQNLSRSVFMQRVNSELYRMPEWQSDPGMAPDQTAAAAASAKVEGKEEDAYNVDGLRRVYEIYVDYPLPQDRITRGKVAPYIITVDEHTHDVLACYRNWDADDKVMERLDWVVEFGFIPWRGPYPIGLTQLIGSLAAAATGAINALLDSAHANNMPGALKLGGARMSGQTVSVGPTEITEITGPTGIDDIRKLAMPLPFNPPSEVLMKLVEFLVQSAKNVVSTASERIADASNTMPVGTALALIEQGAQVFSSIHARLHHSQARCLAILHRLNATYLEDEEVVEELGELVVFRSDFEGPVDVVPVSDPNIFSEAQRYAQLQAVMQLAGQFPQLYAADVLNQRFLQLLGVPNFDELLTVPAEAKELDAITENAVASRGKQKLKAYSGQEHLLHLQVHVHYMASPVFGRNPLMQNALPVLVDHCKEHLLELYLQNTRAAVGASQIILPMLGKGVDTSALILQGVAAADQKMINELGEVLPLLMQCIQQAQQVKQPPLPPELMIKQQEINQRAQQDQQSAAIKNQLAQQDQALKSQGQQFEQTLATHQQKFEEWRTGVQAQLAARDSQIAEASERYRTQMQELGELYREMMRQQAETFRQQMELRHQGAMGMVEAGQRAVESQQRNDAGAGDQLKSILEDISSKLQAHQEEISKQSSAVMDHVNALHEKMAAATKQRAGGKRGTFVRDPRTNDISGLVDDAGRHLQLVTHPQTGELMGVEDVTPDTTGAPPPMQ